MNKDKLETISNLFEEELNENSVIRKIIVTDIDDKDYNTNFYILAVYYCDWISY